MRIRLRREQISDLGTIRDLDVDTLRLASSTLERLSPLPLRPERLLSALSAHFETRPAVAEILISSLLSLAATMRQAGLSEQELLEALDRDLRQDGRWTDDELGRWSVALPAFRAMLGSQAVRLVAAAIDLSYEYANLLRRARILTDIRPIFATDATRVDGAVVSYNLRLKFDNAEGDHELTLALDESDVRDLQAQCERALVKARTARDLINSKDIPILISGEIDRA